MRRFFASSIGQIVAITVCSTVATMGLFVALVFVQNTPPGPPWPWAVTHRIVSLVNLLEGVPARYRSNASLLAAAQQPDLAAHIRTRAEPCRSRSLDALTLATALRVELQRFPEFSVRACQDTGKTRSVQVLVPLGDQVLEIRTGNRDPSPFSFSSSGFGALVFMLVSIAALSAWAIWRVVKPLRRLLEQADAFGRGIAPAPIREQGTTEIRNLARALNLMQARVARALSERTRMLAAIGHDLRTPLTRMRLQLDADGAAPDRAKLLRNIRLMQTMVDSALAFLGEDSQAEPLEWVDLDALLSTLCDEYEESGVAIQYHGPGRIGFHCRPNAIQRALANLIDNAAGFGQRIQVAAVVQGGEIVVEVVDDGPGIPARHLQEVLEPFVRLDASRQRPGSIGLGLSIVAEIARLHGGRLVLANAQPHGLVARLAFPLAAGAPVDGAGAARL